MSAPDALYSVRVLPDLRATGQLLHAHLEAYDHLAVATDLPDGSIEIAGPASRRDEITEVVVELSRVLRLLRVG